MYLRPSHCPVCDDVLAVTRMHCNTCDTSIEGRFKVSRLEQLTPEQLAFVELFVRCEGKLNWAAQEMRVSYPTVRARLDDAIRGLGYEVREMPPAEERQRATDQRQAILDDLAGGKISSAEAVRQLQSL